MWNKPLLMIRNKNNSSGVRRLNADHVTSNVLFRRCLSWPSR